MLALVFSGAFSLQLSALSRGHLRAPGPSTGRCFRAVPDIESLGLSTLYLAAVAAGGFLFFALKFKPLLILPPVEVEGIAFLFVFVAGCVQPLKSREATWKVAGCGVISLSLEAQLCNLQSFTFRTLRTASSRGLLLFLYGDRISSVTPIWWPRRVAFFINSSNVWSFGILNFLGGRGTLILKILDQSLNQEEMMTIKELKKLFQPGLSFLTST